MLLTLSLRFFRQHLGQLLALLLCLATGVGAFLAIAMVNASALMSFESAAAAFKGNTTHRLIATARDLDFNDYVVLKVEHGVHRAAPVLELTARFSTQPGFKLIGVEVFAEQALGRAELAADAALMQALRTESVLALQVSRDLAAQLPTQDFELQIEGLKTPAKVIGILPSDALGRIAIVDLGALLALRKSTVLSRVDVQLSNADAGALQLDAALELSPVERQDLVLRELTRALRTNLLALSLLALLVAVFLISQSFRYAWLLRARDFARLRSLGLSRFELRRYLLLEAAALGLLGGVLGGIIGSVAGAFLSQPLSATFAELYGANSQIAFAPSPWLLLLGVVVAILAAIVGALLPLAQAERRALNAQLQRSAQEQRLPVRKLLLIALALSLLGAAALAAGPLTLAFVGLMALTLAATTLVPAALLLLLKIVQRISLTRQRLLGGLSLALAERALSRLGAALAALTIALATPVGLDLMVSSFRGALIEWLDRSVIGDFFLTSDRAINASDIDTLRALPGVIRVHATRHRTMDASSRPYDLMAIDSTPERLAGFEMISGQANLGSNDVLISEAFAAKRGLQTNDPWLLKNKRFVIRGVFRDYRSEHGVVAIGFGPYQALFNDALLSSLSVVGPQSEPALTAWAATQPALRMTSRTELKAGSLRVFERTFALTDQLKLLTAVLAGIGVFAALLALELERAGLDARLRALGFQRSEVRWLKVLGAMRLSLLSGVLAMPLGAMLALLLTDVINRRAFGWSFALKLDWPPFAQAIALALGCMLLALLAASALAPRPQRLSTAE